MTSPTHTPSHCGAGTILFHILFFESRVRPLVSHKSRERISCLNTSAGLSSKRKPFRTRPSLNQCTAFWPPTCATFSCRFCLSDDAALSAFGLANSHVAPPAGDLWTKVGCLFVLYECCGLATISLQACEVSITLLAEQIFTLLSSASFSATSGCGRS